jgi:hypothetical protein
LVIKSENSTTVIHPFIGPIRLLNADVVGDPDIFLDRSVVRPNDVLERQHLQGNRRFAMAHTLEFFTKFVKGQRFDLRFSRPFRADLSIKKSSSFFPPLIAATSQRGLAPRPAQVSPNGLRYFGGTFLPFNARGPAWSCPGGVSEF